MLGVSPSGFYEWRTRPKSKRALEDEVILEVIRTAYKATRESYGYRRMHDELKDEYGIDIGRDRTARIMRQNGIVGLTRRKFRRTTLRDESRRGPRLTCSIATSAPRGRMSDGWRTSPM